MTPIINSGQSSSVYVNDNVAAVYPAFIAFACLPFGGMKLANSSNTINYED